MPAHSQKEISQLLLAWSEGDQSAFEQLAPLVHEELRRLAHHYMRGERPGHTLQTSALINAAGRTKTRSLGKSGALLWRVGTIDAPDSGRFCA